LYQTKKKEYNNF